MEKVGFIKGLKFLRTNGVAVDQITTDKRHSKFRKHRRRMGKTLYISLIFVIFARVSRKI